jgi:hypothetical protein
MKVPFPRSYWVDEGRLLAGEYPGAKDQAAAAAKLAELKAAGIDFFLDLTEDGESAHDGSRLRPYLDDVAPATVRRFAVRDLDCPTVEEMRTILDAIDEAIAAGRRVYVHCWGGVGRTGTVVGCWLIRHGRSADDALSFIRDRRHGQPAGERPSPETKEQRRFVEAWVWREHASDRVPREAIARAVLATAQAMSTLAAGLPTRFVESDLEPVFAVALRYTANPLSVKRGHKVNFTQWQPKIGPVDVAVLAEDAPPPPAFVELKWGAGTLYNCVWDAAKMAVAVAGGYASRGFLLAGAPESDWTAAVRGAELFDTGTRSASYLFNEYADCWAKWRKEVKTRPQSIPSRLDTVVVESAQMLIAGEPWRLRAAEVLVPSDTPWHTVPVLARPTAGGEEG